MNTKDHVSLAATIAAIILAAFAAVCVFGETQPHADYVDGENSAALVTNEAEAALAALVGPANATALAHALRLNMGLYDADMRTQAGRRHWHGKLVKEEIYTNQLFKIEVWSNEVTGATWRFRTPFKPTPPKQPKPPTLGKELGKDGVPARLAAARAKRAAENASPMQTKTIVIEANK